MVYAVGSDRDSSRTANKKDAGDGARATKAQWAALTAPGLATAFLSKNTIGTQRKQAKAR
jgi:hypothetical protein